MTDEINRALPASVRVERSGPIAIVRLTRPEKRNALNIETVRGLGVVFGTLDPEVRAVVLAAAGEHFSAGLDLSDIADTSVSAGLANSRAWYRVFDMIQFGDVPVVTALHGGVIGGGFELAAATHIRVADRSTYYGLPEGQRGIFVGGGGSVRISRLIGATRMMDLMLTGRTYDASEGQAIGISQYLTEVGQSEAKAIELAHRMAQNAPFTTLGILHAIPRVAEADPATGYLLEGLVAAVAQAEPEAKRRLTEFLAGRAAKVTHER